MCFLVIFFAVGFFVMLFAVGFGVKLASRFYQQHTTGGVDEELAVTWQNRAVLVGILFGFFILFSRISFSA